MQVTAVLSYEPDWSCLIGAFPPYGLGANPPLYVAALSINAGWSQSSTFLRAIYIAVLEVLTDVLLETDILKKLFGRLTPKMKAPYSD